MSRVKTLLNATLSSHYYGWLVWERCMALKLGDKDSEDKELLRKFHNSLKNQAVTLRRVQQGALDQVQKAAAAK